MEKSRQLMIGEEIFNSITHGIGILFCLTGLIVSLVLIYQSHNLEKAPGLVVFGGTLILTYLFSTLFHSLSFTRAKKVFLILDHASIFLLIAGTYTPFTLLALPPKTGWILLLSIWVLAVAGITFKSIYPDSNKKVSLIIYLSLGWLSIIVSRSFLSTFSVAGIGLLFAGGLCYTIGAVFYLWRKLPFNHGIWHLFVMTGSLCHFLAALYLLI